MRLIIALCLAAAATPVLAQQQPPTPPPPAPDGPNLELQARLATPWAMTYGQRLEYDLAFDEARRGPVSASLERVDLANRVSGLIQLGRCTEARALAREEGDRVMAMRTRELCRSDRD